MYEAPSSKIILKRIGLTLGVIIGIVAIAWGVISLLKTFTPQAAVIPEPASGRILKPTEVIEAVTTERAISALNPDSFNFQISQTADVIYKPASSSFAIVAQTPHNVLFSSKTAQTTDISREVLDQVAVLLESGGYKKIENVGSARSENPTYATFETPLSVCQLSSSRPSANSITPLYHKLACIDKTTIQTAYESITPLLALFKESGQTVPAYDEVSRTSKTEGNKSLAILYLSGSSDVNSLLFAAIDNKWSYLGNLSGSDGSQTNGKYVLSAELRRTIADPRYSDFLTKNLQ